MARSCPYCKLCRTTSEARQADDQARLMTEKDVLLMEHRLSLKLEERSHALLQKKHESLKRYRYLPVRIEASVTASRRLEVVGGGKEDDQTADSEAASDAGEPIMLHSHELGLLYVFIGFNIAGWGFSFLFSSFYCQAGRCCFRRGPLEVYDIERRVRARSGDRQVTA